MKRHIHSILLAGIVLCATHAQAQQVLELATGRLLPIGSLKAPTKTVTNTSDATKVSYEIKNVFMKEDSDFKGEWVFSIEGFGGNDVQGQPAYLVNGDTFEVPDGYTAVLTVNECNYKEFSYKLGPVHMQEYDVYEGDAPLVKTVAVQPYSGLLPKAFVSLGETETYRGRGIQYVNVSPIQYDYARGKVRIITKLSYTVSMKKDGSSKLQNKVRMNVYDDAFINNLCLNAGAASQDAFDSKETAPKEYLIVTTPKFETEVKRFARWKKIMGYKTHVISKSSWTVETVKQSIVTYATNHPNLYYLLIVGDYEDVPTSSGTDIWKRGTYISDYTYACINNGNLAELYIGRVPVSTSEEARTVFDKIINYEKNPINTYSFYKNAVHAAYYQIDTDISFEWECRGFITAAEKTRDIMMGIGKTIERIYYAESNAKPKFFNDSSALPQELLKPTYNWLGNKDQISNSINNGVFYVFHRDHGNTTGWGDPSFYNSDISNLKNGKKLPVIFSINCETGKFNTSTCFAEQFIRKKDGGCVGIIAAGGLSPTTTNDKFSIELFKLIANSTPKTNDYRGSTYTLGEILKKGIFNLIAVESLNSTTSYERKIYHCFGDPSMVFLTSKPIAPKGVKINQNKNSLTISTTTPDTDIVVYDEKKDEVSIYKKSSITLNPTSDSNISVCVKSPGMRPVIYENIGSQSLNIQNETFENDREYVVDRINIGEDLDDNIPQGEIEFASGSVKLTGKVCIGKNVKIQKGVEFKVSKQ